MASTYGRRRDDPAYDKFRTGLTFRAVRQMLNTYRPDRAEWRRISRGTVLGKWHQLKMEMWDRVKQEGE
jgi:hypothetical protein